MEDEGSFLETFSDLTFNPKKRRVICSGCRRPITVCLCEHLPKEQLNIRRTSLYILQHPNEESRPLNTVSILNACLTDGTCTVYKGKKFTEQSYPGLHETLKEHNTFLLFPVDDAQNIEDIVTKSNHCDQHYNILLLDGTWKQASSIYAQNKFLKKLKKVKLRITTTSEYVIRTQPSDSSLSTLECAAIALSHTEQNDSIKQALLKPLRALCKYQLDHGAVVHHSKEYVAKYANS